MTNPRPNPPASVQSDDVHSTFENNSPWTDAFCGGGDYSTFFETFDDFILPVSSPTLQPSVEESRAGTSDRLFEASRFELNSQGGTLGLSPADCRLSFPDLRDEGAEVYPDKLFSTTASPLNHILTTLRGGNPTNTNTLLADFYFQHIAPLLCCSKDIPNPFHGHVKQNWTRSSGISIAYAIQSMSLACLARSMPSLHRAARALRDQCLDAIKGESDADSRTEILLNRAFASVLLGSSAGWFQPRDSMIDWFRQFKELLGSLQEQVPFDPSRNLRQHTIFLRGVATYWGMFLSFMTSFPQDEIALYSANQLAPQTVYMDDQSQLHPWTGISEEVCELLRRTGLLIRASRERASVSFRDHNSEEVDGGLDTAQELERSLNNISFQMPDTCEWQRQLYRLAEAYRLTALLQLYRAFPDLLRKDLPSPVNGGTRAVEGLIMETSVKMATQILSIILAIPPDLHALRFQLVPLVAASSELGISPDHEDSERGGSAYNSLAAKITLAQARTIVRYRLDGMQRVFPGDRMSQMTSLIQEVWKRLDYDTAKKRPYWVDVAIENDWDLM